MISSPIIILYFIYRIYKCCDGFSNNGIDNNTSLCVECENGFYGENCKHICSCENGGKCSNVDGSCQCLDGYYDNKCQKSCNCDNDAKCNAVDGSCVCQSGYYGSLCESKCTCGNIYRCDDVGICICQDGFYGVDCVHRCNCSNDAVCDPTNGTCNCKPGYYGNRCEHKCPCYNGGSCGEDDPSDCHCGDGWGGSDCTQCNTGILSNGRARCHDKCLHCYNGNVCTPEKGDCECTNGWQGNKCDGKCNTGYFGANCSGLCKCLHGGSCDHVTGACACQLGWKGEFCEIPCPANCLDCRSMTDDVCKSCKPGWQGTRCSESCRSGYYGDGCRKQCVSCQSGLCDPINGTCHQLPVQLTSTLPCLCTQINTAKGYVCECSTKVRTNDKTTDLHDKNAEKDMKEIIILTSVVPAVSIIMIIIAVLLIISLKRRSACIRSEASGNISTTTSNNATVQQLHDGDSSINPTEPDMNASNIQTPSTTEENKTMPIYATVNKEKKSVKTGPNDVNNTESVGCHEYETLSNVQVQNTNAQLTSPTTEVSAYAIFDISRGACHTKLDIDNVTMYNSVDRSGKQYKQREHQHGDAYEELKPLKHENDSGKWCQQDA
ncbi:uncharacterized protein LOC144450061 [Glandiceps talaboti]